MSYFTRGFLCRGLLAAGALAWCRLPPLGAQAADYDVGAIHISAPWARATPKGASNGCRLPDRNQRGHCAGPA